MGRAGTVIATVKERGFLALGVRRDEIQGSPCNGISRVDRNRVPDTTHCGKTEGIWITTELIGGKVEGQSACLPGRKGNIVGNQLS